MNTRAIQQRVPKLECGWPIWWHHHGYKLAVKELDLEKHVLVLEASAANLTVRKGSLIDPEATGWYIDWEVVQCKPTQSGTKGRTWFNDEDLKAAFCLSDSTGKFGDWILERFGGDSANQGRYIRWKEYLNIPGPGTGHDGDSNISIYVDEDIQNAVHHLLSSVKS
jgi:hypothetical protein